MPKQIFVNLPVKDLKKSMGFFSQLGFTFNPQFTDDKAACMVVEENIFVMLLKEEFFKTFIKTQICDTGKSTEAIFALSYESREQVSEIMEKAVKAGGTEHMPMQDHDFMLQRSFRDPDGHSWEVFCMDISKFPKQA